MNRLRQLQDFGQSVWLDNIHRAMLRNGELANMIREDGLRGITSNPTIFEKAITGGTDYDAAIAQLIAEKPGLSSRDMFFTLAVDDIQAAADMFVPVYSQSRGLDGYVSLEVSPDLAANTDGTIDEARRLWKRVDRPNLMIKVPATREGLPAVEQLINDGINVNVTLLFSVQRYREVVDAYLCGLESRMRRGQPVDHVASVASFFVSRVDSAVDKALASVAEKDKTNAAHARELRGKLAVGNAKLAYQSYKDLYGGARFATLKEAGAGAQRLLWASTGTKSAEYSDVLYIEELVGRSTVNTIPPATYAAFKDHGMAKATLDGGVEEAARQVRKLGELGIDLNAITDTLEKEGVDAFAKSFNNLLGAIETKAGAMSQKMRANG
jgi:transaldolase